MVYIYLKYFADFILSLIALIILMPLFLIISILIKLTSRGPVLFRQKRVGKDCKLFYIHKFRTMRIDTPKDCPTHLLEEPQKHITKIGKFLRKTSLDELPQIWDIFRGKMTIIGPRPALYNQDDLIAEREKYGANSLRPGLTGLAQVSGRDELDIPVKAKIDGEYVENISLCLDIKIFFKTVFRFLKSEGVVEGGTGILQKNGAEKSGSAKEKADTINREDAVQKIAFLSMDVEDWYHTGYIQEGKYNIDKDYSMLDGVDTFIGILNHNEIKSTFFIVANLLERHPGIVATIAENKMEIACHGLTHISPVAIENEEYGKQILYAKQILSNASGGKEVIGLRAPSYALDDVHFKQIENCGFKYDSSRIYSDMNTRYGSFDMSEFHKIRDHIYINDNGFTEFVVSTQTFLKKNFPLGGGTFRILPWWFIRHLIRKYLKKNNTFLFFIHPYELSGKKTPKVKGLGVINRCRFNTGRKSVKRKIEKMVKLLKSEGFNCITYSQYLAEKKEKV